VVADAHEEALRSFAGVRYHSWGRRAGRPLQGAPFRGSIRLVDAGGGTSPSSEEWGAGGVEWSHVRSAPLLALLGTGNGPRESEPLMPERSPRALAIVSEEQATVDICWPGRRLLVDACLAEDGEANLVYVALRGEPPPSSIALEDATASHGFRVVPLAPGLTAWLAGRSSSETRRALGRVGTTLAVLGGEDARAAGGRPGPEARETPVETFNGRGRA
jgi:hypothetical protein